MQCRECHSRPVRRQCPALGRRICATCCGTKRQVEIRCPDTCQYLVSARQHPPAVECRQAEVDFRILDPMARGLTSDQERLLSLIVMIIAGHSADPLVRLTDADVAGATGALASTYETAGRGLIYEHRAESPGARRLAAELTRALANLERRGLPNLAADAAVVLRRLERAARDSRRELRGGETAFRELLGRLARDLPARALEQPSADLSPLVDPSTLRGGGLIVPGR